MKIVGIFLACYLILLSAIPCCAVDYCTDDKTDLAGGTEQADNHPEEDGDCDNCSPFFNCEGCATATIAVEPASLEIIPIISSSVYTGFIQLALPGVEYDFWQPPKLG